MLLLRVTDSRGTVTQHLVEKFPYRIGRSTQSHLRLEEPGIFEQHASIVPAEHGRFLIRSEGESLLLRGGEALREAQLVPGDELSLGSARIMVSLAPARQKRLALSEAIVWLLLAIVAAGQTAVLVLAR